MGGIIFPEALFRGDDAIQNYIDILSSYLHPVLIFASCPHMAHTECKSDANRLVNAARE